MRDRDVRFHKEWLGLAQPVEGLVFSIPVLADAQIAPDVRPELSSAFEEHLDATSDRPRIRDLTAFFREFLGYDQPGMLVAGGDLPPELSFIAAEGGQEIRPTFALGRGPFQSDDPFAIFERQEKPPFAADASKPSLSLADRFVALCWDLAQSGQSLDLDEPETVTGPWRYPPTAKFERLLRQTGIPVGFIANGESLRLVYAPAGETTAHLTFRVRDIREHAGRPILAALDLLLHARRTYNAAPEHTLEGLLAESRRRQADVTEALARQVFEAVEILVAGFEAAAARDCRGDRLDWLRSAMEAEGDHFYQGALSVVLRIVFLLYAEDQALLPVEHPVFAEHLSLFGLHARLSHDAGAHPDSMHSRFGAYGQLLSLFRAVFFGVRHGSLHLPPRRGKLFDPNAYPFLEGGQPDWTAAVVSAEARAAAVPPSIDDETIYRVLHRLVVFEGQRLSYRELDVEQIGSVYESLMGYHVVRVASPAVRIGKYGVWVEADTVRQMSGTDRARFFKETCGLNPGPVQSLEKAMKDAGDDEAALVEALSAQALGRRSDILRHRVAAGRLVLQPGEERRRTGSHYTPRSLTEKVVRRTLEPLLACLGPNRTAEQILQLKVCDPAMGSGAFLVAACRELAAEIVQAWTRSGEVAAVIEAHGDAHLHARRLVAQQCLYGVDKNRAAVELAKLSLWLVTLSKTLPFTFVDHALRPGDSLVGLDFDQIRAFHWAPKEGDQVDFCDALLKEALEQAVDLRQQILALAEREDPGSQAEKRRLLEFARQAIERVRLVADVCAGAFFAEAKDAAREKERRRRLDLVRDWLAWEKASADSAASEADRQGAAAQAAARREVLDALAEKVRKDIAPFHWWLEFPEVFFEERPDPLQGGIVNGAALMEAVVGNPPFGGKNNIIDGNAPGYLDWLKAVHPGAHGNSDLSAHFFRRATMLLGQNGAFGLIATNTIAQGDTRGTGLKQMLGEGWTLFDATSSLPWPGAAAVTVSLVHGAHGRPSSEASARLDGRSVAVINSRLRPKPERRDPISLKANKNSSFQGSIVLGMGFTLTPEERDALVGKDPRNAERILPYLGGEEVNTSPTQSHDRYVISFGQMTLEEAERWPDLIAIVREKVKPERDKNNRENYRLKWWQFGEMRPGLYAGIGSLRRCLVTARTSKHTMFSFQPSGRVFSENLVVFPLADETGFATLQSRVHTIWVRNTSSTLEDRQGYRHSDCFETFAFPHTDPRVSEPALQEAGRRVYDARARFMSESDQGLTDTYNALKDSACTDARILELRRRHEEMDAAVLTAYGWSDIAVPPFCPLSDADRDALQAFEDDIIDRLYVLNAERAAAEQRLADTRGDAAGAPSEPGQLTRRQRAPKRPKVSTDQGDLF